HDAELIVDDAEEPSVQTVGAGVDMVGEGSLELRCGLVFQSLHGVKLDGQIARDRDGAQLGADKLVNRNRGTAGNRRLEGVQGLVAAFADKLVIADVQEGVVGARSQRLGCVKQPGGLKKAYAHVVITKLQSVAEKQIQKCGRDLSILEVLLGV